MCRPSPKIGNVGQVANLPKTRQIDNPPHLGISHIYCDGPYNKGNRHGMPQPAFLRSKLYESSNHENLPKQPSRVFRR